MFLNLILDVNMQQYFDNFMNKSTCNSKSIYIQISENNNIGNITKQKISRHMSISENCVQIHFIPRLFDCKTL